MATKMKKILIAEDDPFLSKIISNRLREEGFDVTTATDGAKAIGFVTKTSFDLIMLDLIMPVKDGFEVLAVIKKNKIKTPVLVFSNLSQKEDEQEVMALGAKGFFVKSNIAIDELVKTVRQWA